MLNLPSETRYRSRGGTANPARRSTTVPFSSHGLLGAAGRSSPAVAVAGLVAALFDRYRFTAEVLVARQDGTLGPVEPAGPADETTMGALVDGTGLRPADPTGAVPTVLVGDDAGRTPGTDADLVLHPSVADGELLVEAHYDQEVFDNATVEQILEHLGGLAGLDADAARKRFADVDILTDDERALLLGPWNAEAVDYPAVTLHRLFAEQAARTPDAVALVDGDRELTYGDFDRASNRVARQVRPLISRAGDVVAVSGHRSIELFVCKMGVLKAGAAFLHLEPTLPGHRVSTICRIARPRAVIRERRGPFPSDAPQLFVDDLLKDTTVSDEPLDDIATPESTAYILFTSGSTGEPKGVVRPHRMHTTRVFLEQGMYGLSGEDRHLLKAAPFFREFFWPLATGGTAVVARPGGERDDEYLVSLIREQRISVASFVPSMLRVLLENPGFAECDSLRHLFTAGEVLPLEVEAGIRELGIELHNTYTLAEADYVCHRGGALADPGERGTVGRPLDMRVYLCDERDRLVPPGVVGEILTGGPGTADGYLNRPDLTAERFVPNPFDDDGFAPVLFRSGDLARFREDGQVEYIGRSDLQIKIRGMRVEPTEVEAFLRGHPDVGNAVVSSVPDTAQGNLLVAYVVADGDVSPGELKTYLREVLPEYMVPTYLAMVEKIPMLGSGKADRSSLKVDLRRRPDVDTAYAPPVTDLEKSLVEVWSQVLGVDEIGIDDAFLALGGDSLRAMLLRSALENRLGRPVPLATLFESSTIRVLARELERAASDTAP